MRASIFTQASVCAFTLLLLASCGQRVNGNYALTQSGLSYANQSGCQQINLAINENGGQVSGSGSNACFTETIMGTMNGNTMQVTVTITPTYNNQQNQQNNQYTYYNSQSVSCMYSGQLMISGNQISGTLSPSTGGYNNYNSYNNYDPYNNYNNYGGNYSYGCGGSIQITGTRN